MSSSSSRRTKKGGRSNGQETKTAGASPSLPNVDENGVPLADNADDEGEEGEVNMEGWSELDKLEYSLEQNVDGDFFHDPRKFHTLHRVIDVLGAQMDDGNPQNMFAANAPTKDTRANNPAYRALKKQQLVVEDAIEHMAVEYSVDLNSSVVQVGKVARQFSDAVSMVRQLRRQVRDIQETLGSSNPMAIPGTSATAAQAAAMSLRELWLKKLECESVLNLLEKMELVRAAPGQFDLYISPPNCRIGAAVVTLSKAFDIAFQSNVAAVHALQNVSAQITDRRQRADQIIWDTLLDVIYLRTGNGVPIPQGPSEQTKPNIMEISIGGGGGGNPNSATNTSTSNPTTATTVASTYNTRNIRNPFITKHRLALAHTEVDDDDDDDSMVSWFSHESEDHEKMRAENAVNVNNTMIPLQMLEAELDLVADEQRCLEETLLVNGPNQNTTSGDNNNNNDANHHQNNSNNWQAHDADRNLPRYVEHILALRILVECLAKLKRLDDVERTMSETLAREIRKIAQKEQAKTFGRLEKLKRGRGRHNSSADLSDFRRHLVALLSSFGCVMIRLSHLAQILRHRITSEEGLVLFSYTEKSSALRSVLMTAYDLMQKEIKDFMQACLKGEEEDEDNPNATSTTTGGGRAGRGGGGPEVDGESRGLFSLGITDDGHGKKDAAMLPESRANQMQQSAAKFVTNVLLPKTNTAPEVRHALEFRRSVAVWTTENEAVQRQLATATGEDPTSPSFNLHNEEKAIHFLDGVIKKQLIPVLQHDAINGTTKALEREDAFDPVIDRQLFGRPNSNEPQDVDMCIACQALYNSTGPLFMALHRLPKDEKMYLHVVGVLEHAILTFISRVKPRVGQLCGDKMSFRLLMDTGSAKDGGKDKSFSAILERRKPFAQMLNAYADGDLLEAAQMEDAELRAAAEGGGMAPIHPPNTDTKARNGGNNAPMAELDLVGGVDKEEQFLAQELVHLQSILEFTKKDSHANNIVCCTDEELMKASCLGHSLLKLSSLLDSRLKVKVHSSGTWERTLTSTRALREAIKTIKAHGVKMAKFCRIDMLMQNATRLQKICKSSTLVAKDAVRIPSCVNDLGEYLTGASDNLREAGGNAVTAYTFSSLEQYIPLFLMQTVRVIAKGDGIVSKSPLTLNGVESLDRSGSVLYRDLKGATSFDNSFWDDELAAISFERSASFMAMMEVEMEELEEYFRGNHQEFSDIDFALMFNMDGPRRRGDIGKYHLLKKKLRLK